MTISESLKRFRKTFKLTQRQVAEFLGLSQQMYQYYESRGEPSASDVVKLADKYNVSADYLLGRTDETNELKIKEKPKVRDIDSIHNIDDVKEYLRNLEASRIA